MNLTRWKWFFSILLGSLALTFVVGAFLIFPEMSPIRAIGGVFCLAVGMVMVDTIRDLWR